MVDWLNTLMNNFFEELIDYGNVRFVQRVSHPLNCSTSSSVRGFKKSLVKFQHNSFHMRNVLSILCTLLSVMCSCDVCHSSIVWVSDVSQPKCLYDRCVTTHVCCVCVTGVSQLTCL